MEEVEPGEVVVVAELLVADVPGPVVVAERVLCDPVVGDTLGLTVGWSKATDTAERGSVIKRTVDLVAEVSMTCPTSPDPDTTGMPTAIPSAVPLSSSTVSSKLEADRAITWHWTVGRDPTQGRWSWRSRLRTWPSATANSVALRLRAPFSWRSRAFSLSAAP